MGVSKIILDGSAICDISSDTVDKSNLAKGTRAIGNSGDAVTGEAIFGGSEYAIFDSSTSSRLSGSDAVFYLCKTDNLITINTKARMNAPPLNFHYEEVASLGYIPSTWGVTKPTSASMTSTATAESPLYIAKNQLCYQFLYTLGSGSTIASAWSLVVPNYKEAFIPPISSTWTLKSGYSGNACVNTSKSSLTIVKMDNIAYLHGTIYLSSDQTSGDWVTIMTVPEGLRPPADFGVPVIFRYTLSSSLSGSSSKFTQLDGALTKSGKLQLKSVQHNTLLLGTVIQQGTKAGLPLDYDLVYPLDFGTRVK